MTKKYQGIQHKAVKKGLLYKGTEVQELQKALSSFTATSLLIYKQLQVQL